MEKVKQRRVISPNLKIVLGFASIILIGSFILMLPISSNDGNWISFFDALFTATSAVCVTGLVVFDIATQFTIFGQIIILLLIQIGGLGIVAITSFMFLLLRKKINLSSRITLKESLNKENIQGVVAFIKKVLIITFTIEIVGALLLMITTFQITNSFWKGIFIAIFTSVSSFCNAGIDILGSQTNQFASLSGFAGNVMFLLPIMFLIVLGGIGFVVLIDGFKNFKSKQHIKIVLIITAILVFGGAILFIIFEWNNINTIGNMSVGNKILNGFFQSITTRTCGAATVNQALLTEPSKILTMILMFIGGSPNSTAGGIKTTTFLIILVFSVFKTNESGDINLANRRISNRLLLKALKILIFFTISILIALLTIRLIEPAEISTQAILFECISAIGTVGLSFGITPILTSASEVILALLMFVGRVGVFTIILAISARETKYNDIQYQNTDIIIG